MFAYLLFIVYSCHCQQQYQSGYRVSCNVSHTPTLSLSHKHTQVCAHTRSHSLSLSHTPFTAFVRIEHHKQTVEG